MSGAAGGGGGAVAVEKGGSLLLRREKGRNAHEKAVELIVKLGSAATDAFTTKITERGGGHGIQLEITGTPAMLEKARQLAQASGWRVPSGRVSVSEVIMVQPIPYRGATGFNAAIPTRRGNWGNMTRRRGHSRYVNAPNRGTRRGHVSKVQADIGYTDKQLQNILGEQSARNARAALKRAAKHAAEE